MLLLRPGSTLGRYRIEAVLGQGAMGIVYLATDTILRREVALKVIGGGDALPDAETKARFLREARAAAGLVHANVVSVFDAGEADGLSFLAMEIVKGTNLRARIADASVALEQRMKWLLDVARALAAAHARGLVHRDVKPDNVLVSEDGVVKLTDFGIVRPIERGPSSFRTATGEIFGTPDYMAPEQWQGADVDARADQYAWGLVAYELLSRKAAPVGKPPPLRDVAPEVPEPLCAIVMRAIEHERDARFPSMDAIVTQLDPIVSDVLPFAVTEPSNPAHTPTPKRAWTPHSMRAPKPGSRKRNDRTALTFLVAATVTVLLGGVLLAAALSRPAAPVRVVADDAVSPSATVSLPPPLEPAFDAAPDLPVSVDATAPATKAPRRAPAVTVTLSESIRCASGDGHKTEVKERGSPPELRAAVTRCVTERIHSKEAFAFGGELHFVTGDGGPIEIATSHTRDIVFDRCLLAAMRSTVHPTLTGCAEQRFRLLVSVACKCLEAQPDGRRLCWRTDCD